MTRHIRRGTLLRHTLLYNLFKVAVRVVFQCSSTKAFKPALIILLLAYGGINAILFAIAVHLRGGGSLLLAVMILTFNAATAYYTAKGLNSLSGIMSWIKAISGGALEYEPDMVNISPAFAGFAKDIGNLQNGMRRAVAEAVRGERLKTELITNVSHDLKTPLTSIISYVDLLKGRQLNDGTSNEYIGILEEKSARLKQLVDDLLEASKAASGDMAVNFGSIDIHSLIEQAMAEYSAKAEEAGLDIRIKMPEAPVVVRGDGALMWRIMDNLLSNVVKYSQRNSRVYIEVE